MNLLLGMDLDDLWAWMEDYASKVMNGEYKDRKQEHMHLLDEEDYIDTPPIDKFDLGVEFDWCQSRWKHNGEESVLTKLTKYNDSGEKILMQIAIISASKCELDILVRVK